MVSTSVTKEPRRRHLVSRNVDIMRFLVVDTAPPQVFVTDVDTIWLNPVGVA